MPYIPERPRRKPKARIDINIHQNEFTKGFVSTVFESRRARDSLSDLTNMEITSDSTPRPRPPLVRYGDQFDDDIIGHGTTKWDGERSELFMVNVAGVGKIYKRTDGTDITLIGGSYDDEAWTGFCQSHGRAYIFNGIDNLSYVDLDTDTIVTYTTLATPVISSVTKTGLASTTYTQYYRVSANNAVGESIASTASSVTIGKVRDAWILNTDYIDVTWGAVVGATSYTVYTGDTSTTLEELVTVAGVTYRDDGSLATNFSKLAPEGNSTAGAIFTWMYNDAKSAQIFGVTTDNYLYYAAPGTGDFSPYNGGGYVGIDIDGDTVLNFVDGFRTGKGDPVITVSSRGAAGKGKLNHVTFESLTISDQVIIYPNVFEANGQSGTYAPRCTIKAKDSLTYPTGTTIKSTGTSQNINNILTTNSVAQGIQIDCDKLDLSNLHKAVGIEYQDRLYMALPVNASENNEIWYQDLSRKGLWVLRWQVSAKDLWLYEDSNGATHFCALVNNVILEFTRTGNQTTQDDGVPFSTRCAFSALIWDEDGIILATIRNQYFKFLQPKGAITVNAYGLSKRGLTTIVGSESFLTSTTPTGYDQWMFEEHMYDEDPGPIGTFGKSMAVLKIKPRGLINQLTWEILTETANCDYYLSAVNTRGLGHNNLIYKG